MEQLSLVPVVLLKLLVIGGGGREHALAWKLAQSPHVGTVYVAPGNAGTAREPKVKNIPITEIGALAEFAVHEGIAFTVVGPEGPLADGIVNFFRDRGLKIVGSTREATQLESSKDFAKEFMKQHGIPTASYESFTSVAMAHLHVNERALPMVIKADGLAAGKGAFVCKTLVEAHDAIDQVVKLGVAGRKIIIEKYIDGEEASFIVMCDGHGVLELASSQDHKRLLDGDEGPNTGGMGAISPVPIVTSALRERIMREIIMPTVHGMAKRGIPYTGFLYAGLMIDHKGSPKVLEFNCRLGDPETQPIMMRLKSDFVEILEHALAGTIHWAHAEWDDRAAVGVVLAAANYPGTPKKGATIKGLPEDTEDCKVFHAGTLEVAGDSGGYSVVVNGGRALCATALGENFEAAQQRVYQIVDGIHFDGMQCRRDIGYRAVNR